MMPLFSILFGDFYTTNDLFENLLTVLCNPLTSLCNPVTFFRSPATFFDNPLTFLYNPVTYSQNSVAFSQKPVFLSGFAQEPCRYFISTSCVLLRLFSSNSFPVFRSIHL